MQLYQNTPMPRINLKMSASFYLQGMFRYFGEHGLFTSVKYPPRFVGVCVMFLSVALHWSCYANVANVEVQQPKLNVNDSKRLVIQPQ